MKKLSILLVLFMAFMSCENNEPDPQPETEFIYFYDWDMTIQNSLTIHNPIEVSRIVNYSAVIYKDYDLPEFKMFPLSSDEYSFLTKKNNVFIIDISKGGVFDSDKFDNNDQIRGHVKIDYY